VGLTETMKGWPLFAKLSTLLKEALGAADVVLLVLLDPSDVLEELDEVVEALDVTDEDELLWLARLAELAELVALPLAELDTPVKDIFVPDNEDVETVPIDDEDVEAVPIEDEEFMDPNDTKLDTVTVTVLE
jgi:hypothetical protein